MKDMLALSRSLPAHIPGRSVVSISSSSTDDYLTAVTSVGEMLMLDMVALNEREEKGVDALLGHMRDQVRRGVADECS